MGTPQLSFHWAGAVSCFLAVIRTLMSSNRLAEVERYLFGGDFSWGVGGPPAQLPYGELYSTLYLLNYLMVSYILELQLFVGYLQLFVGYLMVSYILELQLFVGSIFTLSSSSCIASHPSPPEQIYISSTTTLQLHLFNYISSTTSLQLLCSTTCLQLNYTNYNFSAGVERYRVCPKCTHSSAPMGRTSCNPEGPQRTYICINITFCIVIIITLNNNKPNVSN